MEYFNDYQYRDLVIKSDDPYAKAKYELIIAALAGNKSLNILNAGCGSGELSFLLAEQGHIVFGIDPAPEHIVLAKSNLPPALANQCTFSVSSIEELSAETLYDAVVATDVLEHISDDRAAAEKLARLARPGGLLIITVPSMPSLFGFHDEQLGHFRRYRAGQLKQLIEVTGLIKIKKLRYFGFTLIPVCFLYSKVWRKSYPLATTAKRSWLKTVLHLLLFFDKYAPLPLGTSLILIGARSAR